MLKLVEKSRCFNGYQEVYIHESKSNKSDMQFALFKPDEHEKIPVLFFLSGITCTEQNFIQKSGFQKFASEKKIAVVVPDTSPRGKTIKDSEVFNLGKGAGFYLNAISNSWKTNYNMYDYVSDELPNIIESNFKFDLNKLGIFGHSMGGGGAIQIALKNKKIFKSISAFSPICSLFKSNFSSLAIKEYLNSNNEIIKKYDPISLIKESTIRDDIIKIDVGLEDEYLNDLFIDEFEKECVKNNQKVEVKRHKGYGHNYYFLQTFIKEHLDFHFNQYIR